MAGLKIETELRPCIVRELIQRARYSDGKERESEKYKDVKALFHQWSVIQSVMEPSWAMGGHPGGQIQYTVGIVEYEDGTIHECYPLNIKFIDGKINEYCFEEIKQTEKGE